MQVMKSRHSPTSNKDRYCNGTQTSHCILRKCQFIFFYLIGLRKKIQFLTALPHNTCSEIYPSIERIVFCLYPRRHPVTKCMKYLCRKRSHHVYTLSNLKMHILKHAWISSRIIWSTQKPKISKPQVEGHTSLRSLLRGNLDLSEYHL